MRAYSRYFHTTIEQDYNMVYRVAKSFKSLECVKFDPHPPQLCGTASFLQLEVAANRAVGLHSAGKVPRPRRWTSAAVHMLIGGKHINQTNTQVSKRHIK